MARKRAPSVAKGIAARTASKGKSTHAERIEYARQLWTDDPSISLNGRNGMHYRLVERFGVAPRDQQLVQLHAEVERERRANRRRARVLAEAAERTPMITTDKADELRSQLKLVEPEPEPEPKSEPEPDMGSKVRPRRSYTPGERAAILANVENRPFGETVKAACRRLDVPAQTISSWRSRMARGVSKDDRRRAEVRVAAYEYRKSTGATQIVIAKRFKISHASAARYTTDHERYEHAKQVLALFEPAKPSTPVTPKSDTPIVETPTDPTDWNALATDWLEEEAARQLPPAFPERRDVPPSTPAAGLVALPSTARESIAAAMRMLLDEVPGLVRLEYDRKTGTPTLRFEVIESGEVEL
jgi:hypothetical protein